ncbi:MAG: LuxR C-terminal-related transcriptional regulator [Phycisphaerales bacterium]
MFGHDDKATPAPPPDLSKLSKREREILTFIAQGLSTPQIADKLFRSRKTIDSHRANLARKLGARNRVQLTRLAVAAGLVPAFAFAGQNEAEPEDRQHEHVLPTELQFEVASAARICFWEWDVVTDFCRVSTSFLMILGFDPADFTSLGASWFKAVHPDDRDFVSRQSTQHLQGSARSYELIYRMITADGQPRLFRVMCFIMRDSSGKARRVLGVSQDLEGHAVATNNGPHRHAGDAPPAGR